MPPTAFAVPLMTMKRSEAASRSLELGGRGGLLMTPGLRSRAKASAGGPSATTLIHSSCTAVSGSRNVPPAGSLRPSRKARPRPAIMSDDERQIGREEEADELLDVLVDAAAFLDGRDDGGEVVVEQHDVGNLPRDVAAALPHGDTDVGALERRRVVDAVSRDGDDLTVLLEGFDQAQLVLGRHARKDVDVANKVAQLIRRHRRARPRAPVTTRSVVMPMTSPTALAVAG